MKGNLFVISGPSGVGKTTVKAELVRMLPRLFISISATTRAKRDNEIHGRDYLYLSKDEFEKTQAEEGFFEWASVHGNLYGTPKKEIMDVVSAGKDALMVIDTQGAIQVKSKIPSSVLIFLLPPSMCELENRLLGRGTENLESIRVRLDNAQSELNSSLIYDFKVINFEVCQAALDVARIIYWCTSRRKRD